MRRGGLLGRNCFLRKVYRRAITLNRCLRECRIDDTGGHLIRNMASSNAADIDGHFDEAQAGTKLNRFTTS